MEAEGRHADRYKGIRKDRPELVWRGLKKRVSRGGGEIKDYLAGLKNDLIIKYSAPLPIPREKVYL